MYCVATTNIKFTLLNLSDLFCFHRDMVSKQSFIHRPWDFPHPKITTLMRSDGFRIKVVPLP